MAKSDFETAEKWTKASYSHFHSVHDQVTPASVRRHVPTVKPQPGTAGDLSSMYNAGLVYDLGEGVDVDPVEAAHWFRKAAEAGHPSGMHTLQALSTGTDGEVLIEVYYLPFNY